LGAPSCAFETNTSTDISEVDILFIGDYPMQDEIEEQKPIFGKRKVIFRQIVKKYGLHQLKYFLMNSVLCANIDIDGTFKPQASIKRSEFVKIFIILALSKVIEDHHQKNTRCPPRNPFGSGCHHRSERLVPGQTVQRCHRGHGNRLDKTRWNRQGRNRRQHLQHP